MENVLMAGSSVGHRTGKGAEAETLKLTTPGPPGRPELGARSCNGRERGETQQNEKRGKYGLR